MILQMIGVFISVFLVDIIWVFYIQYIAEKKAIKSANFGSSVYVLGSIAISSYTHDYIYVIPAAIGAWLGTWTAVKLSIYLEKRKQNKIGS